MAFAMPRLLRMLITLSVVAATTLSFAACNGKPAPTYDPAREGDLVLLADGTTMDARPGTLNRAVADWLTAGTTETESFDLGADTFVPGTAQLSPQGVGRVADLSTLLLSAPKVQLQIGVAKSAVGDLATARATTLARFLEGRGIATSEVDLVPTAANGEQSETLLSASFPIQLHRREAR